MHELIFSPCLSLNPLVCWAAGVIGLDNVLLAEVSLLMDSVLWLAWPEALHPPAELKVEHCLDHGLIGRRGGLHWNIGVLL